MNVTLAMPRFFVPNLDQTQKSISLLDKNEIHHLSGVLRLKSSDTVTIFNGHGLEAQASIRSISRTEIIFQDLSFCKKEQIQPLLILACAIPKRSKFETIIEKCTELGIDEIIPLKTQRTEIALSEKTSSHRLHRYEEVAMSACKQSHRSFLPMIHPITKFDKVLECIDPADLTLIGCLKDPHQNLRDLGREQLQTKNKIVILIGPEGDFTENELLAATQHGCIPISLGPNILRVETAAIASVAYLMLQLRA